MSKRDLFSFKVGEYIIAPENALFPGYNALVVDKATIPMGFTEGHLVKIEYGNGLVEHFDCSHEMILVEPIEDPFTENKPNNISLKFIIKSEPDEHDAYQPIGSIPEGGYIGRAVPKGWLECNGATVKKEDYSELFSVIGNNFSVERKVCYHPITTVERIKKFFGIKYIPRTYTIEIGKCSDDEFMLPDLRGEFFKCKSPD